MTFGRKAAAAAAAAMMFASPALAEVSVLMRVGAWEVWGGTTTKSGTPVCTVGQDIKGRFVGLKIYAGKPLLTLQLGSKEWTTVIVDHATTPMTLRFDAYPPWTGDAIGMHFPEDGAGGLELNFERDLMDEFISQFRKGNRLVVTFGNASMAEWVVNLAGTNAVADAFLACARKLN
jgi:hypothetical protein